MLLYTVKYKNTVFDVVANNFDEVLKELSAELGFPVSKNEVILRAAVRFRQVTLSPI